jgi:1,4-alpha-glucan branching enzyme
MPQRSDRPGFGSIPYPGSVTFRVWAPNATAVTVYRPAAQDQPESLLGDLAAESNGSWSADVSGLQPGDEYRYRITGPSGQLSRLDPCARQVTNSVGNVVIYDPDRFVWTDAGYQTPGWDELVIYELHVGTFNELPGDTVGTLADAAQKLPYLARLGVSAVELLPLAEFATDTSWGYNPGVPYAVESAYTGAIGPDALKAFVQAAHDLGIAVILDVVYNHFGWQDLALWQYDGWYQTGAGRDGQPKDFGGIYFYQDWRYWTGYGDRPDYGRPEVRDYIAGNVRMWLQDYRIDGLRLDATSLIRNVYGDDNQANDLPDGRGLLRRVNEEADAGQPWKLIIAEDMKNDDWVTRPAADGGAGFDSQWDPSFVADVRAQLRPAQDTDRSMAAIAGALTRRYNDRPLARVVFTESHDEDGNNGGRLPHDIDPQHPDSVWAKKRSALGAAIMFTAPGIPMMFQGQEILEDRWFTLDQTPPVDWAKETRFKGIWMLYQDLIRLRRNGTSTTGGLRGGGVQVHHVNDIDKVTAYHRWTGGGPRDDVLVVANFADRRYDTYTVGVPRGGAWLMRFCSDDARYDGEFDGLCPPGAVPALDQDYDGMPARIDLPLGRYAAVILSQDS